MARKRKTEVQRWFSWIRERTGKTHEQLADDLGVSVRTLRAWLYGERTPRRPILKLLESTFGKPPPK